jgi:tetratricopeptide (TPR) repeat protein
MANFFKKYWKFVLAGVLLVVLIIAGWVIGSELYRPVRTQKLTQQATQALQRGDLASAQSLAVQALLSTGNYLPAIRVLGSALISSAPEEAVSVWSDARKLSGDESSDVLGFAQASLASGNLTQTQQAMDILRAKAPKDLRVKLLDAKLDYTLGRKAEALRKIVALTSSRPDFASGWFFYATLVRDIDRQGVTDAFLDSIDRLTDEKSPLFLWASTQSLFWIPKEDFLAQADKLLTRVDLPRSIRLNLLMLSQKRLGVESEALEHNAGRYFNMAQRSDQKEYVSFLLQIGDFDAALKLVTPKLAIVDEDFFRLYLLALEGKGDWQAVAEIASNPKLPFSPALMKAHRALALSKLGQAEAAQKEWSAALEEARSNYFALGMLTQLALDYKLSAWANQGFGLWADSVEGGSYPVYALWMNTALEQKDIARALTILARAKDLFPQNIFVQESWVYYNALAKRPGDWVKLAYNLAQANPGVPSCRVALGLTLLQVGENAKALATIQTAGVENWDWTDPSWQMVRAAILKANGQQVPDLGTILDKVLPEESTLLK